MTYDLSEESLKHVEAGAAAHRAALEINRALRDQLDHVKVELARANTENDHLRLTNHDLAEKLLATEQLLHGEIAKSSAYWATIEAVAAQILNVKRKVDPAEEVPAIATSVPQDAANGGGKGNPLDYAPTRYRQLEAER